MDGDFNPVMVLADCPGMDNLDSSGQAVLKSYPLQELV
jgi:hypothetical protein